MGREIKEKIVLKIEALVNPFINIVNKFSLSFLVNIIQIVHNFV